MIDGLLNLIVRVAPANRCVIAACLTISATAFTLYMATISNVFPDSPGSLNDAARIEPDELALACSVLAFGIACTVALSYMVMRKSRRK